MELLLLNGCKKTKIRKTRHVIYNDKAKSIF